MTLRTHLRTLLVTNLEVHNSDSYGHHDKCDCGPRYRKSLQMNASRRHDQCQSIDGTNGRQIPYFRKHKVLWQRKNKSRENQKGNREMRRMHYHHKKDRCPGSYCTTNQIKFNSILPSRWSTLQLVMWASFIFILRFVDTNSPVVIDALFIRIERPIAFRPWFLH